ncbi:hypothetical protein ABZ616_14070 [Streptomyces noursei]|uniref:Uncharacterized protein n=1 Tax=Streptomyces mashuensis TaxID=33904 RepID=A0A919B6E5_9ACTN|nr:hypothetical protein [Streptomyces mashuensis]GHF61459.1 hypothetical protein GCM10010218_48750 [Streptomyces mashuensis]
MEFLRTHSVRILAALAALVPLLVARWPGIDWYGLAAVVAALLGAGEMAQRVEDSKTSEALHKTSPYDELAAIHMQLAQRESESTLAR